jgi:acetolactate synthase-1/2/3 large subunit
MVFNNRSFANVRRDQLTGFDGNLVGSELVNPDFVALAESFGAAGYRVDSPEQLRPALEKALANDAPAVIEIETETGSETSPWEFIMMQDRPSAGMSAETNK